ncbi:MAG TPA: glycoside hydrolase 100 family protein [Candidatus Binatia bacterium]|nr:glycoside hydrolase 100 family protein [Candidatus Binatia bacterium]
MGRPQLVASLETELEEGCDQALAVLRASAAPDGLVASATLPQYAGVWTRDVAFSALGAHAVDEPALTAAVGHSLVGLAQLQAESGQIPNAWWPQRGYWDFHEAGCTDATCLFVVAASQHLQAHPDPRLERRLWPHLRRAMRWLECQDANQFTLIDSPSGGDWMDSTLQRSGKLLYVNVLYYRALQGMAALTPGERDADSARAKLVRRKIDLLFWPEAGTDHAQLLEGAGHPPNAELSYPHPVGPAARGAAVREDRGHYLSHVDGGRYVDECDVLGNVLAVLYGVAGPERARRIMEFLDHSPAARPYPMRTYTRSFEPGDRWGMYRDDLEAFQDPRWRNPPGRYHNGGVWPFIGALFVVALQRVGMVAEAGEAMRGVGAANRLSRGPDRRWGFHEWIDAETGEPAGAAGQSWSAGTYLLAAEALRGKPVSL